MSEAIIDPSSSVWRELLVICPCSRKWKSMLDQEDIREGIGSGIENAQRELSDLCHKPRSVRIISLSD